MNSGQVVPGFEPTFLSASDDERAGWRGIPMTVAFIDYLEWESRRISDAILVAVRENRHDDSRQLDGTLAALQLIQGEIFKQQAKAGDTDDENFHDPAAIWSKR